MTDIQKTVKTFRLAIFLAIVVVVMMLDQLTKQFAATHQVGDIIAVLIPGALQVTLVHNTGAAWGMFGDWTNLFVVIALIVCIFIVCFLFFNSNNVNTPTVVACALLFSGGLGNALDRFLNGYVIDMIQVTFIDYPVFNVADCAITIGVIIFVINMFVLNRR